MSMVMAPAVSRMMLVMFRARRSGIVKELPMKSKFVYRGETFAFMSSSPTWSCHHGIEIEMAMSRIISMAPARPSQLMLIFGIWITPVGER